MPMDVRVGDVLRMKKAHPCGGFTWVVLRSGMDFRLRCERCGREVLVPRAKAAKGIRQILHGPTQTETPGPDEKTSK